MDEVGALAFQIGGGPTMGDPVRVTTGVSLTARRWYHVEARVDPVGGTVTLVQSPIADHTPNLEHDVTCTAAIPAVAPTAAGDFYLAAARASVEEGRRRTFWHFNLALQRQDRPTFDLAWR